jgi:hypothetical protein
MLPTTVVPEVPTIPRILSPIPITTTEIVEQLEKQLKKQLKKHHGKELGMELLQP